MDNLSSNQLKIKHLYSRAGFGIRYSELKQKGNWTIKRAVDDLFEGSEKFKPLSLGIDFTPKKQYAMLSEDEKKEAIRSMREGVRSLNTTFLQNMSNTDALLREKMTLFWHGHFACRSTNPNYLERLNNVHREHGLGNFRTLLTEVSKSPAMLQFLNNQQNRKGHPNENFARELMELFTIGRGNYTESDIRESARAFTGWGFSPAGEYAFRQQQHDTGQKTFMGKTGNFGGEEIIDIILNRPETSQFIARKIYIFLVNDKPDETIVNNLGKRFKDSNYEISTLLKDIFTSTWFYDSRNVGAKIKSPVELIAGLNRQFFVNYQNPQVLMQFQSALGQVLFYPPNVAGWPGGQNWIDSSSLMTRLRLPSMILNGGEVLFDGKADPEDEAIIALNRADRRRVENRVQASVSWDKFLGEFPKSMRPTDMASFMLQPSPGQNILSSLGNNTDLKTAALEVVSMPEYQLT